MRLIFIRKKWIILLSGLLLFLFAGWYLIQPSAISTSGQVSMNSDNKFTINLVTGEFATKTEDGKEIEAYRWDPGTFVVPRGKEVTISIFGVNGKEHPFYIEGTEYKGIVQKGKETTIKVQFDKKGTYRLVCMTHSTIDNNGPMIGYIVVD